jgi:hypothetical protein
MPDELKDKFQQLVADPPPPSAVPSEAVFAKVRTVRRRRTAGVAVLAAAAVVAIAVAGNNLTEINSSPPVANTPGVVSTSVAPPPSVTTNPSTAPRTSSTNTSTSTRPPSTSQSQQPPAAPPVGITVTLIPKVTGRSLQMKVTIKGALISPLAEGRELPPDTGLLDRSMGTDYQYGDGEASGSDAGAVSCTGARKRVSSQQTYSLPDGPHVYQQAGTYTFKYTIRYCGAKGQTLEATKSARIVIR